MRLHKHGDTSKAEERLNRHASAPRGYITKYFINSNTFASLLLLRPYYDDLRSTLERQRILDVIVF